MKVAGALRQLPSTMSVSFSGTGGSPYKCGGSARSGMKNASGSKSLSLNKSRTSNGPLNKSPTKAEKVIKYIDLEDSEASNSSYDAKGESEESTHESSGRGRRISSSSSSDGGPPRKRVKNKSQKDVKKVNQILSDDSQEEEFSVEKIIDMKEDVAGKRFYYVKWLNYGSHDNTWEPEENLEKCQAAIDEYNTEKVKKPHTRLRDSNTNLTNKSGMKEIPNSRKDALNVKRAMEKFTGRICDKNLPTVKTQSVLEKVSLNNKSQKASTKSSSSIPEVKTTSRQNRPTLTTHTPITAIPPVSVHTSSMQQNTPPSTTTSLPSPTPSVESYSTMTSDGSSFTHWFEELIKPVNTAKFTPLGNLFYFRIIRDSKVEWILLDMLERNDDNELYRCIVTEDLNGKEPKFIYGATKGESGEIFCLVQFEGYSYVDVIPPAVLFKKYPSFKKFFEIHCARHFQSDVIPVNTSK